jgi:hypothetical protein
MMGDSMTTAQDLLAQHQVLETFKGLAPLLGQVTLQPNPRESKRSKTQHVQPPQQDAPMHQVASHQQPQLLELVKQLSLLVLRHERELNMCRRTDSFVLFFNKDPKGGLSSILTATQKWQEQRKTNQLPLTTLRQHLTQSLFADLLTRVTKLSETKPEDQLFQVSIQTNLIDEKGNWAFLDWDHNAQSLVKSSKKPISMTQMLQFCQELVEVFRSPDLVVCFQSLQSTASAAVSPWRLQLNPRADREWELLETLCRSSVWTLIGTMLKPHSQLQSGLANAIQQSLGHRPPKGKGKGKHKQKHQNQAA